MEVNVGFALLITTLAGLSTGIGSAIAYFIRKPKYSHLAVMMGFSAGVMVYISFAELLKTAIDEVGFGMANIGFFAGIAFIGVVDLLVPHELSLIHISEPTRLGMISYAVFCLKKKKFPFSMLPAIAGELS